MPRCGGSDTVPWNSAAASRNWPMRSGARPPVASASVRRSSRHRSRRSAASLRDSPALYSVAAAFELLHTAFVVHDDVIDHDTVQARHPERRR